MEKESPPNAGLLVQPSQLPPLTLSIWYTQHKGQLAVPQACLVLPRVRAVLYAQKSSPTSSKSTAKPFHSYPGRKYSNPLLPSALLSTVSVIHGQLQLKNIKLNIPEVNNSWFSLCPILCQRDGISCHPAPSTPGRESPLGPKPLRAVSTRHSPATTSAISHLVAALVTVVVSHCLYPSNSYFNGPKVQE